MNVPLVGIELEDLLVDRDRADHESLVRKLIGYFAILLDRLLARAGEDEGIGKPEPNLSVTGIALQEGVKPVQRLFVLPLLKTLLYGLEWVLSFFAAKHWRLAFSRSGLGGPTVEDSGGPTSHDHVLDHIFNQRLKSYHRPVSASAPRRRGRPDHANRAPQDSCGRSRDSRIARSPSASGLAQSPSETARRASRLTSRGLAPSSGRLA